MSVHLSTENIQTTISQLNRDFSGRRESPDYDEHKLVHIHRRNRPFVWNKDMQVKLLDSILKRCGVNMQAGKRRHIGRTERLQIDAHAGCRVVQGQATIGAADEVKRRARANATAHAFA